MSTYRIQNGNELCHYGVLGMKWGVRRYRNADGTLTPAGKNMMLAGQNLILAKPNVQLSFVIV